ncbi:MAG: glycosyltransferase, partial [Candidatus Omnitrophota bacterium]
FNKDNYGNGKEGVYEIYQKASAYTTATAVALFAFNKDNYGNGKEGVYEIYQKASAYTTATAVALFAFNKDNYGNGTYVDEITGKYEEFSRLLNAAHAYKEKIDSKKPTDWGKVVTVVLGTISFVIGVFCTSTILGATVGVPLMIVGGAAVGISAGTSYYLFTPGNAVYKFGRQHMPGIYEPGIGGYLSAFGLGLGIGALIMMPSLALLGTPAIVAGVVIPFAIYGGATSVVMGVIEVMSTIYSGKPFDLIGFIINRVVDFGWGAWLAGLGKIGQAVSQTERFAAFTNMLRPLANLSSHCSPAVKFLAVRIFIPSLAGGVANCLLQRSLTLGDFAIGALTGILLVNLSILRPRLLAGRVGWLNILGRTVDLLGSGVIGGFVIYMGLGISSYYHTHENIWSSSISFNSTWPFISLKNATALEEFFKTIGEESVFYFTDILNPLRNSGLGAWIKNILGCDVNFSEKSWSEATLDILGSKMSIGELAYAAFFFSVFFRLAATGKDLPLGKYEEQMVEAVKKGWISQEDGSVLLARLHSGELSTARFYIELGERHLVANIKALGSLRGLGLSWNGKAGLLNGLKAWFNSEGLLQTAVRVYVFGIQLEGFGWVANTFLNLPGIKGNMNPFQRNFWVGIFGNFGGQYKQDGSWQPHDLMTMLISRPAQTLYFAPFFFVGMPLFEALMPNLPFGLGKAIQKIQAIGLGFKGIASPEKISNMGVRQYVLGWAKTTVFMGMAGIFDEGIAEPIVSALLYPAFGLLTGGNRILSYYLAEYAAEFVSPSPGEGGVNNESNINSAEILAEVDAAKKQANAVVSWINDKTQLPADLGYYKPFIDAYESFIRAKEDSKADAVQIAMGLVGYLHLTAYAQIMSNPAARADFSNACAEIVKAAVAINAVEISRVGGNFVANDIIGANFSAGKTEVVSILQRVLNGQYPTVPFVYSTVNAGLVNPYVKAFLQNGGIQLRVIADFSHIWVSIEVKSADPSIAGIYTPAEAMQKFGANWLETAGQGFEDPRVDAVSFVASAEAAQATVTGQARAVAAVNTNSGNASVSSDASPVSPLIIYDITAGVQSTAEVAANGLARVGLGLSWNNTSGPSAANSVSIPLAQSAQADAQTPSLDAAPAVSTVNNTQSTAYDIQYITPQRLMEEGFSAGMSYISYTGALQSLLSSIQDSVKRGEELMIDLKKAILLGDEPQHGMVMPVLIFDKNSGRGEALVDSNNPEMLKLKEQFVSLQTFMTRIWNLAERKVSESGDWRKVIEHRNEGSGEVNSDAFVFKNTGELIQAAEAIFMGLSVADRKNITDLLGRPYTASELGIISDAAAYHLALNEGKGEGRQYYRVIEKDGKVTGYATRVTEDGDINEGTRFAEESTQEGNKIPGRAMLFAIKFAGRMDVRTCLAQFIEAALSDPSNPVGYTDVVNAFGGFLLFTATPFGFEPVFHNALHADVYSFNADPTTMILRAAKMHVVPGDHAKYTADRIVDSYNQHKAGSNSGVPYVAIVSNCDAQGLIELEKELNSRGITDLEIRLGYEEAAGKEGAITVDHLGDEIEAIQNGTRQKGIIALMRGFQAGSNAAKLISSDTKVRVDLYLVGTYALTSTSQAGGRIFVEALKGIFDQSHLDMFKAIQERRLPGALHLIMPLSDPRLLNIDVEILKSLQKKVEEAQQVSRQATQEAEVALRQHMIDVYAKYQIEANIIHCYQAMSRQQQISDEDIKEAIIDLQKRMDIMRGAEEETKEAVPVSVKGNSQLVTKMMEEGMIYDNTNLRWTKIGKILAASVKGLEETKEEERRALSIYISGIMEEAMEEALGEDGRIFNGINWQSEAVLYRLAFTLTAGGVIRLYSATDDLQNIIGLAKVLQTYGITEFSLDKFAGLRSIYINNTRVAQMVLDLLNNGTDSLDWLSEVIERIEGANNRMKAAQENVVKASDSSRLYSSRLAGLYSFNRAVYKLVMRVVAIYNILSYKMAARALANAYPRLGEIRAVSVPKGAVQLFQDSAVSRVEIMARFLGWGEEDVRKVVSAYGNLELLGIADRANKTRITTLLGWAKRENIGQFKGILTSGLKGAFNKLRNGGAFISLADIDKISDDYLEGDFRKALALYDLGISDTEAKELDKMLDIIRSSEFKDAQLINIETDEGVSVPVFFYEAPEISRTALDSDGKEIRYITVDGQESKITEVKGQECVWDIKDLPLELAKAEGVRSYILGKISLTELAGNFQGNEDEALRLDEALRFYDAKLTPAQMEEMKAAHKFSFALQDSVGEIELFLTLEKTADGKIAFSIIDGSEEARPNAAGDYIYALVNLPLEFLNNKGIVCLMQAFRASGKAQELWKKHMEAGIIQLAAGLATEGSNTGEPLSLPVVPFVVPGDTQLGPVDHTGSNNGPRIACNIIGTLGMLTLFGTYLDSTLGFHYAAGVSWPFTTGPPAVAAYISNMHPVFLAIFGLVIIAGFIIFSLKGVKVWIALEHILKAWNTALNSTTLSLLTAAVRWLRSQAQAPYFFLMRAQDALISVIKAGGLALMSRRVVRLLPTSSPTAEIRSAEDSESAREEVRRNSSELCDEKTIGDKGNYASSATDSESARGEVRRNSSELCDEKTIGDKGNYASSATDSESARGEVRRNSSEVYDESILGGIFDRSNRNDHRDPISDLIDIIKSSEVLAFTEIHTFRLTLAWFIVYILRRLPALGINDLITEVITVEVGDNWDEVARVVGNHDLSTGGFMAFEDFIRQANIVKEIEEYKYLASRKVYYDIGMEKAQIGYYWLSKIKWLRHKLESGELPYLYANLRWLSGRDDALLLVIVAVDMGIRLHGVSDVNMTNKEHENDPEAINPTKSALMIADNTKDTIKILKAEGKKMACYNGYRHGEVEPDMYFVPVRHIDIKEMKLWGRPRTLGGIDLLGENESIGPWLKGEQYWHIELYVAHPKDFNDVVVSRKERTLTLYERAPHILEMLKSGSSLIEVNAEKRTITVCVPVAQGVSFDPTVPVPGGIVGGFNSAVTLTAEKMIEAVLFAPEAGKTVEVTTEASGIAVESGEISVEADRDGRITAEDVDGIIGSMAKDTFSGTTGGNTIGGYRDSDIERRRSDETSGECGQCGVFGDAASASARTAIMTAAGVLSKDRKMPESRDLTEAVSTVSGGVAAGNNKETVFSLPGRIKENASFSHTLARILAQALQVLVILAGHISQGLLETLRKITARADVILVDTGGEAASEEDGIEAHRPQGPPGASSNSQTGSVTDEEVIQKGGKNGEIGDVGVSKSDKKPGNTAGDTGVSKGETSAYDGGNNGAGNGDGTRIDSARRFNGVSNKEISAEQTRIRNDWGSYRAVRIDFTGVEDTLAFSVLRRLAGHRVDAFLEYIKEAGRTRAGPSKAAYGLIIPAKGLFINESYLNNSQELIKTIIHELGAYIGLPHFINKLLENLTQPQIQTTVAGAVLAAIVVSIGWLLLFPQRMTPSQPMEQQKQGGVRWLQISGILRLVLTMSLSSAKRILSLPAQGKTAGTKRAYSWLLETAGYIRVTVSLQAGRLFIRMTQTLSRGLSSVKLLAVSLFTGSTALAAQLLVIFHPTKGPQDTSSAASVGGIFTGNLSNTYALNVIEKLKSHVHVVFGIGLLFVAAYKEAYLPMELAWLTLGVFVTSLLLLSYAKNSTKWVRFFLAPIWEEGVYRVAYISVAAEIFGLPVLETAIFTSLVFWMIHLDLSSKKMMYANLVRLLGTALIAGSYCAVVYGFGYSVIQGALVSGYIHLAFNLIAEVISGNLALHAQGRVNLGYALKLVAVVLAAGLVFFGIPSIAEAAGGLADISFKDLPALLAAFGVMCFGIILEYPHIKSFVANRLSFARALYASLSLVLSLLLAIVIYGVAHEIGHQVAHYALFENAKGHIVITFISNWYYIPDNMGTPNMIAGAFSALFGARFAWAVWYLAGDAFSYFTVVLILAVTARLLTNYRFVSAVLFRYISLILGAAPFGYALLSLSMGQGDYYYAFVHGGVPLEYSIAATFVAELAILFFVSRERLTSIITARKLIREASGLCDTETAAALLNKSIAVIRTGLLSNRAILKVVDALRSSPFVKFLDTVPSELKQGDIVRYGKSGRRIGIVENIEADRVIVRELLLAYGHSSPSCITWLIGNIQKLQTVIRNQERVGDAGVVTVQGNQDGTITSNAGLLARHADVLGIVPEQGQINLGYALKLVAVVLAAGLAFMLLSMTNALALVLVGVPAVLVVLAVRAIITAKEGPSFTFAQPLKSGLFQEDILKEVLEIIKGRAYQVIEIALDARTDLNKHMLWLIKPLPEIEEIRKYKDLLVGIKGAAKENGVKIKVHLPWCAGHFDGVIRDLSFAEDFAYFMRALETAAQMGACSAVIHIGRRQTPEERNALVELVKEARDRGIVITVENAFAAVGLIYNETTNDFVGFPLLDAGSLDEIYFRNLFININAYLEEVRILTKMIKEQLGEEAVAYFACGFDVAHDGLSYVQDRPAGNYSNLGYSLPGIRNRLLLNIKVIVDVIKIALLAWKSGIKIGEVHFAQMTIPDKEEPVVTGDLHSGLLSKGSAFYYTVYYIIIGIFGAFGLSPVFIHETRGEFYPVVGSGNAKAVPAAIMNQEGQGLLQYGIILSALVAIGMVGWMFIGYIGPAVVSAFLLAHTGLLGLSLGSVILGVICLVKAHYGLRGNKAVEEVAVAAVEPLREDTGTSHTPVVEQHIDILGLPDGTVKDFLKALKFVPASMGEVFVFGGAVRDLFLGKTRIPEGEDIDIVVRPSISRLERLQAEWQALYGIIYTQEEAEHIFKHGKPQNLIARLLNKQNKYNTPVKKWQEEDLKEDVAQLRHTIYGFRRWTAAFKDLAALVKWHSAAGDFVLRDSYGTKMPFTGERWQIDSYIEWQIRHTTLVVLQKKMDAILNIIEACFGLKLGSIMDAAAVIPEGIWIDLLGLIDHEGNYTMSPRLSGGSWSLSSAALSINHIGISNLGAVHDEHNGIRDLKEGKLRLVGAIEQEIGLATVWQAIIARHRFGLEFTPETEEIVFSFLKESGRYARSGQWHRWLNDENVVCGSYSIQVDLNAGKALSGAEDDPFGIGGLIKDSFRHTKNHQAVLADLERAGIIPIIEKSGIGIEIIDGQAVLTEIYAQGLSLMDILKGERYDPFLITLRLSWAKMLSLIKEAPGIYPEFSEADRTEFEFLFSKAMDRAGRDPLMLGELKGVACEIYNKGVRVDEFMWHVFTFVQKAVEERSGLTKAGTAEKSTGKYIPVLPILIAARNEEASIQHTLGTIVASANVLLAQHPELRVVIVVCNNASTDNTHQVVVDFAGRNNEDRISIEVIDEPKAGKPNAIKALIKYTEEAYYGRFDRVLFSDAEVEWSESAIAALYNHLSNNDGIVLAGSNITAREGANSLFSILETFVYYGYGWLAPRGQGLFMRFVSGMGYMANKEALGHLKGMPEKMGNEDVALSALVGPEKIAIVSEAVVKYETSKSWGEFIKIRGRHVRELLRLEKWLVDTYGSKEGRKMTFAVAESRSLNMAVACFTASSNNLEFSITGIVNWLRGIPVLSMPFSHCVVGLTLMAPVYAYLKIRGMKQIAQDPVQTGWEPVRSNGVHKQARPAQVEVMGRLPLSRIACLAAILAALCFFISPVVVEAAGALYLAFVAHAGVNPLAQEASSFTDVAQGVAWLVAQGVILGMGGLVIVATLIEIFTHGKVNRWLAQKVDTGVTSVKHALSIPRIAQRENSTEWRALSANAKMRRIVSSIGVYRMTAGLTMAAVVGIALVMGLVSGFIMVPMVYGLIPLITAVFMTLLIWGPHESMKLCQKVYQAEQGIFSFVLRPLGLWGVKTLYITGPAAHLVNVAAFAVLVLYGVSTLAPVVLSFNLLSVAAIVLGAVILIYGVERLKQPNAVISTQPALRRKAVAKGEFYSMSLTVKLFMVPIAVLVIMAATLLSGTIVTLIAGSLLMVSVFAQLVFKNMPKSLRRAAIIITVLSVTVFAATMAFPAGAAAAARVAPDAVLPQAPIAQVAASAAGEVARAANSNLAVGGAIGPVVAGILIALGLLVPLAVSGHSPPNLFSKKWVKSAIGISLLLIFAFSGAYGIKMFFASSGVSIPTSKIFTVAGFLSLPIITYLVFFILASLNQYMNDEAGQSAFKYQSLAVYYRNRSDYQRSLGYFNKAIDAASRARRKTLRSALNVTGNNSMQVSKEVFIEECRRSIMAIERRIESAGLKEATEREEVIEQETRAVVSSSGRRAYGGFAVSSERPFNNGCAALEINANIPSVERLLRSAFTGFDPMLHKCFLLVDTLDIPVALVQVAEFSFSIVAIRPYMDLGSPTSFMNYYKIVFAYLNFFRGIEKETGAEKEARASLRMMLKEIHTVEGPDVKYLSWVKTVSHYTPLLRKYFHIWLHLHPFVINIMPEYKLMHMALDELNEWGEPDLSVKKEDEVWIGAEQIELAMALWEKYPRGMRQPLLEFLIEAIAQNSYLIDTTSSEDFFKNIAGSTIYRMWSSSVLSEEGLLVSLIWLLAMNGSVLVRAALASTVTACLTDLEVRSLEIRETGQIRINPAVMNLQVVTLKESLKTLYAMLLGDSASEVGVAAAKEVPSVLIQKIVTGDEFDAIQSYTYRNDKWEVRAAVRSAVDYNVVRAGRGDSWEEALGRLPSESKDKEGRIILGLPAGRVSPLTHLLQQAGKSSVKKSSGKEGESQNGAKPALVNGVSGIRSLPQGDGSDAGKEAQTSKPVQSHPAQAGQEALVERVDLRTNSREIETSGIIPRDIYVSQGRAVTIWFDREQENDIRLYTNNIATCTGFAIKGVDREGRIILALAHIRQGQLRDDPRQPYKVFNGIIERLKQEGVKDIRAFVYYDAGILAKTEFPSKEEILAMYPFIEEIVIKAREGFFNADMELTTAGVRLDLKNIRTGEKHVEEIIWAPVIPKADTQQGQAQVSYALALGVLAAVALVVGLITGLNGFDAVLLSTVAGIA